MTQEKDINYWKQNGEENYITTPISVLRYISELEKLVASFQQQLDIPSHMRWHNRTSSQTEISDEEIEKAAREYEIKAFWFGRGINAGRENKIEELKPKKD